MTHRIPALILTLIGVTTAASHAAQPPKSLVGVNTDRIEYYSPMCATIDAIKSSQRFGSTRNPGDGRCEVDENGWPTQDFGVVIAADVSGIQGVYKLACEGKASVSGMWGRTVVRNVNFDGTNTTADVEYRGGGAFALTFSNTSNGVRNLKLLRPGYASDEQVFTNEFLASKEPFGAVRLMNWTRTNDSEVSTWDGRCKPTDAQWSRKGGPWEPWLEYAAKHHKDLWLNVPHMADDDYVRSLARLCREKLADAPVNLYLENTNEYWNRQFKQAKWMEDRAKAVATEWKLSEPSPPPGELRHRYHAKRTLDIGRIFREEWGDDARIRPVLTGQLAGAAAFEDAADWAEKQFGPLKGQIYGVACAPYFGNSGPLMTDVKATPQQLADHLLETAKRYSTPASNTARGVRRYHDLAKRLGVLSLAYEGGADLGQSVPKLSREAAQAFINARAQAQTLPTTGQAVAEYLDWWFNSGGQEFFYYKDFSPYNRSGFFGLSNIPGKIDTPKYQATIDAAKKHTGEASQ